MIYIDQIVQKVSDKALATRGKRLDAVQTAHLTRELTQILPQILEVKYPELKLRSFVPVRTDVDRGAQFVVQKIFDGVGMASIVTSQTTELPKLDIIASEEIRKIVEIAGFYGYTLSDLEAAAFSGTNISAEKGKNARRSMERTVDELIARGTIGGADQGFNGFFNNTNVPQYIFSTPITGMTGEQVLVALHAWRNSVNTQSGGVFTANAMILSQGVYNYLSSKTYSSQVPETILELFKRQTGVEVDYSLYLNDANYDGYTGGYDGGLVYFKDPEVVTFVNNVSYEELPPQDTDLGFKIPVREKFGPVEWSQPLAGSYGMFPLS